MIDEVGCKAIQRQKKHFDNMGVYDWPTDFVLPLFNDAFLWVARLYANIRRA